MKKFSFRLERVLKLRGNIEKMRLQEHEKAQAALDVQSRALARIEATRCDLIVAEQEKLTGNVNLDSLRSYSRYFHKLRVDKVTGGELEKMLVKEKIKRKTRLVRASQEKRALEDYREKQKLRYEQESEKADRSELDELATQRFAFKRIAETSG